MTTPDGWNRTHSGLSVPPIRGHRSPNGVPPEVFREAMSLFDSAMDEFRESVELKENLDGQGTGTGLGATAWNWESALGERGFSGGAVEEVLRVLSEYLTTIQGTFYGIQYGYGYTGVGGGQVGEVIKQICNLIWAFPEYNPMIKQMVTVRGLYVFGQGFEVRGESKKRKQRRIRELQMLRLEREEEAKMQAQLGMMPPTGDETGAADQEDLARNALYQRYGATGQTSSTPGGAPRREQMREEVLIAERTGPATLYRLLESYATRDELDVEDLVWAWSENQPAHKTRLLYEVLERHSMRSGQDMDRLLEAYSGAGGGQQGARQPTGSRQRLVNSGSESEIATTVRELWEDECNQERLCSPESAQRADVQKMVEGNTFIAMRDRGLGNNPELMVWPTHSIANIVVDDLQDGNGANLGYVCQKADQLGGQGGNVVYPDMVTSNPDRLKKVMEAHKRDFIGIEVDNTVRVLHLKEWGPNWRTYGLPGIMASLNSASRYMSFTSEWVVMQRVWRTYAMMITGMGNNRQLTQIQSNYANRLSSLFSGAVGSEYNQSTGMNATAPMAMAAISGMNPAGTPGTRIEPMRTAGSTDPPSLAREIKLLGEMGVGLPDNMFSDTNVGTMSRADVLERNTHLLFLTAQQGYARAFKVISKCAVKFRLGDDFLKDSEITVTWPSMVTPSSIEQAGTVLQLFQGNLLIHRVACEEALKILKREDMHEIMQVMFPRDEDGMEFYEDMQAARAAVMPGAGPGGGQDPNNPLAALESMLLADEWTGNYQMLE